MTNDQFEALNATMLRWLAMLEQNAPKAEEDADRNDRAARAAWAAKQAEDRVELLGLHKADVAAQERIAGALELIAARMRS